MLGLCFGLQLMVFEFEINVCGLKGAHTTEVDPKTKYPVIDILEEQKKFLKEKLYGGTMRLGDWACEIKKGTIAYRGYTQPWIDADTTLIDADVSSDNNFSVNLRNKYQRSFALNQRLSVVERHRHRYEVNPKFYEILQNKGLIFSGIHRLNNTQSSSLGSLFLVEIIELPEKIHPFFLGTQFHPEFKSRFLHPHPIFLEFIKKSLRLSNKK
jgi:CTP synthase